MNIICRSREGDGCGREMVRPEDICVSNRSRDVCLYLNPKKAWRVSCLKQDIVIYSLMVLHVGSKTPENQCSILVLGVIACLVGFIYICLLYCALTESCIWVPVSCRVSVFQVSSGDGMFGVWIAHSQHLKTCVVDLVVFIGCQLQEARCSNGREEINPIQAALHLLWCIYWVDCQMGEEDCRLLSLGQGETVPSWRSSFTVQTMA